MTDKSRRQFFKRVGIAGGALLLTSEGAKAANNPQMRIGSIIDLSLCDGCKGETIPACVSACKEKNQAHFPEPQKPIQPYWPRKQYEDWSDERDRIDRLTPYNWTFVEHLHVDGQEIHVPRRCMHCDNPACLNLCPFGTIGKSDTGAVYIDRDFCMGGAKCRDVCPWGIPQRQAGVGLYLKLAPKLGGGGTMYKCDGCADLQAKGEQPACATKCPKNAITFAPMDEIKRLATDRAKEINGYMYGLKEGGGTGTIYVSPIPFEKINKAIMAEKKTKGDKRPGRPHMNPDTPDKMEDASTWMMASLIAPIAGVAAAAINVYKSNKGGKDEKGR
jgi:Fe-S-cluster-containing dehydrogenase component